MITCNADRAGRARKALEAYAERGADGEFDDCHLGDLIGDLLHLAREEGRELAPLIKNAVGMFEEEIREPFEEDTPEPEFSICEELFGPEFSDEEIGFLVDGLEDSIQRWSDVLESKEDVYENTDRETAAAKIEKSRRLIEKIQPPSAEPRLPGEALAAAADFLESEHGIESSLVEPKHTIDEYRWSRFNEWHEKEGRARERASDLPPPTKAEVRAALREAVKFLRTEGAKR